jgi:hypothetical protein
MHPNLSHRIHGHGVRLAFGTESALAVTRWMDRSRPSLPRRELASDRCNPKGAMAPLARLEISGGSTVG